MYPALAVLDRLTAEHTNVQVLWVGGESGMEADLVTNAGVDFVSIPAAGIHGVGLRRLPGNLGQLFRGLVAARRVLRQFQPDILFFTGGYVAVPMALAGLRIPTLLYVPDIEPGLALKTLALFANCIAVTAKDSEAFLPKNKKVTVTGYPVRHQLSSWKPEEAYRTLNLSPDHPTLLVTGGSLGSLTLNKALVDILPELLVDMQVVHITGKLTWPQYEGVSKGLSPEHAARYRSFPYLHAEMGAVFSIADLVISRAGASSIGEYPHFGIPAILVPYPYAWRYQKVNADYLVRHRAAVMLNDAELSIKMLPIVQELIKDTDRRKKMKSAMQALAGEDAAESIGNLLFETAASKGRTRN
ncbi:MAG: UDP-N-acetylglucosamine--N-acetylmuramyl-(pentapeptide) pyrophosphoryl-undecaprenol N-acetylglucosamine transferase [Anaerolineales bacterium]|nr:UDP-N-acetylglucosamine--N-acetylmuramyl-(pentapeptide) pyrophosphoryl-undecaprenol N-acetylglucosamine transferase [Anaerolineales bacterium]